MNDYPSMSFMFPSVFEVCGVNIKVWLGLFLQLLFGGALLYFSIVLRYSGVIGLSNMVSYL